MGKKQRIRPLAICVFRKGSKILAAESVDRVKGTVFYRPLGGRIEFGERSDETIRRELMEEIGAKVTDLVYLGTIENIFTYEGEQGHEIVQVYDGKLVDENLYACDVIEGIEIDLDNEPFRAVWVDLDDVGADHFLIYPDGLIELLRK